MMFKGVTNSFTLTYPADHFFVTELGIICQSHFSVVNVTADGHVVCQKPHITSHKRYILLTHCDKMLQVLKW